MIKNLINFWWKWTLDTLTNQSGNIGKMLTPPKSKDPWTAMTKGSTGGWAAPFAKPATLLPAALAAAATPFTGGTSLAWLPTALATATGAAQGGFTGLWGKPGLGSAALGGVSGFGQGLLGQGLAGGIQQVMLGPGQLPGGSMLGGVTGMSRAPVNLFLQGAKAGLGAALQPFAGLWKSMTAGLGGAGAAGAAGTAAAKETALGALVNPMTLLGTAGLVASRLPTVPQPPQVGDIASKWLTQDAITKAGRLAQTIQTTEFMGEFNVSKETQAFIKTSEGEIQKAYKLRRQSLDEMGQASNPQWRTSGERLEMHRRLNEEERREIDLMRSQWILSAKQTHAQNQYNTVMNALAVDEDVKRELLYADLADILWKYNIKREDVLELRTLARDAGLYMLENAFT